MAPGDPLRSMLTELASTLKAEAERANERRLLVLAGSPAETRAAAKEALEAAAIDPTETTVVGPATDVPGEHLPSERASELLGRTRTAVVLDCHDTFRPNAVGRTVGAVDGGGLYILCTPRFDAWRDGSDEMDEWVVVPPFSVDDVSSNFRKRTIELLHAHPGVAIVDVEDGTVFRDGLTDPAPAVDEDAPTAPPGHDFPAVAYEECRTEDQVAVVERFERLADPGCALVVEADRGRGKSAAAGIAAASLALTGKDVLVTAPKYHNAGEVFQRAEAVLSAVGALTGRDDVATPRKLSTTHGLVRFEDPADAATLPGQPDVVIVDEAAGLPVSRLSSFSSAPAVAFTTTIHGYEGAGRGFSVRFRDRLAGSRFEVATTAMTTPIRYGPADPVETWAFRTLMLDARPAADELVSDVWPGTVEYQPLEPNRLLDDEHLLREAFGLLVLAHYRTEPDDLARLLDAPNVTARALVTDGHVASIALLAREGGLSASLRREMYFGGRVRGNMLPDVLTTQLRDEHAGVPVGQRVLRIATHPAIRSRGLGSRLLSEIRAEFADAVDWLGTGFGATPELIDFWAENGYRSLHLSTTRNDASGEHSAVMVDPCSQSGRLLAERHASWFLDRLESSPTDAHRTVDPDVVRAVLGTIDRTPTLSLADREWRLVAGVPGGAATIDTDPGPFRRLTLRHLVGRGERMADLDPQEERLLVRKVLQAHAWDQVASELSFVSERACKRGVGEAIETLVRTHGTTFAQAELDRY